MLNLGTLIPNLNSNNILLYVTIIYLYIKIELDEKIKDTFNFRCSFRIFI